MVAVRDSPPSSGDHSAVQASLDRVLRYFRRGLLRSRRAADALSIPFGLFALADRFMTAGDLIDGASGAFFLGRKRAGALAQHGLALEYLGSQRAARG